MEQFYFVLTEKCNLTCSHCIRESSPYRDEAAELELIVKTIDRIKAYYPNALILLSGGEPTIYKSFLVILRKAISSGLNVKINSNGVSSFFRRKDFSNLASHSNLSVQISLDGVESIHDSIRGERNYKRTIKTIWLLLELGIKCSVSTTVLDYNFFNNSIEFIEELDGLGLTHIAIKRVTYAGRASQGFGLKTSDWNHEVNRLRKKQFKTKLILSPMYDFEILDKINDDVLSKIELSSTHTNCGAGVTKVYIYPNGDVCSCTCFKNRPMGNLYDDEIDTILASPPIFNVDSPICKSCRYLKLCNGGCPGSGYQFTGIIGSPDPRCPKIGNSIESKYRTLPLTQLKGER